MMGPEAALVSERLTELRRLGGQPRHLPPHAVPMYAEAAARARLEPPAYRLGLRARFRAALRGRLAPVRVPVATWTVAGAPIVAKEERARGAPVLGMAGASLAALPLQAVTDH
ncbi:MAG TPA: hypothetical protein VEG66_03430 [Thermoplasmata archaeon]|jgi:hypothetical protein|nr:hypothetical protein [Thermoplasmata archaeon]